MVRVMERISKESKEFIEEYVLKELNYTKVDEENVAEIVDYIIDNFEVPLAQAKEAGEVIDENLLKRATNVVTEITSNPKW